MTYTTILDAQGRVIAFGVESEGWDHPIPTGGSKGTSDTIPTLIPTIPTSVTMRQARLALLSAGLLSQVDAALAAIADPVQRQAAQIDWEYAATVDRGSPLVSNLAASLNLDSAALDTLFTAAGAL